MFSARSLWRSGSSCVFSVCFETREFWWGLFIIPAVYVVVYVVFYTIVGDL